MRRLPAFLGFAVQVSIRDLTGYAITADGVLHLICQSARHWVDYEGSAS